MKNYLLSLAIFLSTLNVFAQTMDARIPLENTVAKDCAQKYAEWATTDGVIYQPIENEYINSKDQAKEVGGVILSILALPLGPTVNAASIAVMHPIGKFGRALLVKGSPVYEKMFAHARTANKDLTEESFIQLIQDGFSTDFCATETLAGPKRIKKFFWNSVTQ